MFEWISLKIQIDNRLRSYSFSPGFEAIRKTVDDSQSLFNSNR